MRGCGDLFGDTDWGRVGYKGCSERCYQLQGWVDLLARGTFSCQTRQVPDKSRLWQRGNGAAASQSGSGRRGRQERYLDTHTHTHTRAGVVCGSLESWRQRGQRGGREAACRGLEAGDWTAGLHVNWGRAATMCGRQAVIHSLTATRRVC